jgi:DNA primase
MSGVRSQVRSQFKVYREFGDEMLVSCPHPDHEDTNPSASINVRKRLWVCYGCGKGGSLDRLLNDRVADEAVEDVLKDLADLFRDQGPKVYPEAWLDQFDAVGVHPYWTRRGLSEPLCRQFRLGYDLESQRATYPLRTPSGAVLGVVGRATKENQYPRYQYPTNAPISETLFAYYLVRSGVRDVVLVEGAIDALAMWDVGIPAVAQMGSRLSREQTRLLRALGLRTLTIAYDQDAAGRKAMERAVTNWALNFCMIRLMTWDPDRAKDPMELTPDQRMVAYQEAELVWGGP